MPQYEEMYYKLFNAVTDAIEALKTAQKEVEDMYIKNKEEKASEQLNYPLAKIYPRSKAAGFCLL